MKGKFSALEKYLQEKGHKKFFVIGFCWGVWFSFKLATQFGSIIAIGGMHPSLGLEQVFGGDVNELTKKVQSPAYFFPAGNDPENIKPNGEVVKIL
jgi:dienelactone hydrolase